MSLLWGWRSDASSTSSGAIVIVIVVKSRQWGNGVWCECAVLADERKEKRRVRGQTTA